MKPVAFLPNPKDANRETSVFRHGAGVPELWELAIGNDVVPLGRTLHGAAIVRAGRVMALSLSVVAAEPPERHAGVRNWPWTPDDPVTTKARQLELAQELVRYADLVLKA